MTTSTNDIPRIYADLASWWPLLSPPEEYADEAALYEQILLQASDEEPASLLELGSGGGSNAYHLKHTFTMTLVDYAEGMLDVSRIYNPECEHVQGDMRTVRLEEQFDAVFAHDAIMHMSSEEDLRAAFQTAFIHLKPGGIALFVPDFITETFEPHTIAGGHDGNGRSLRYLQWVREPHGDHGTAFYVDFAYLLDEENGLPHVEQDRLTFGLFNEETWLRLMGDVGFTAERVHFMMDEDDEEEDEEMGMGVMFLGRKPR
jgi:SAM-dependent methyltransferase